MTAPREPTSPAHDELARLARENAALRAQLDSLALAPRDASSTTRAGTSLSPTSRRWMGRAIMTALVGAAFALGARYGAVAQSEWARGVRDAAETRAREEPPAATPDRR